MTPPAGSKPNPLLALILGWVIPGAGHAYAGRWGKATLFFSLITGLLVAGFILGGLTNIQWNLWLAPQLCAGGPTLALWPLSEHFGTPGTIDWADRLREVGTLYTAVAGFLNLLVMMDAYIKLAYPHEGRKEDA